jgi:hypothetical protein
VSEANLGARFLLEKLPFPLRTDGWVGIQLVLFAAFAMNLSLVLFWRTSDTVA